jgi:hypothetical protein
MDEDSLRWLRGRFECDAGGCLTRAGFHGFHAYVAQHTPDDLWAELRLFGFDRSLRPDTAARERAIVVASFRVRLSVRGTCSRC